MMVPKRAACAVVIYTGQKNLSEAQQENRCPWFLLCKGEAPLCTLVAMEHCPPCVDMLCSGAAWPFAYFTPPYSILYSQAD